MKFRVAKRFARVEALGAFGAQGRVNDPADPITLMVRVTDSVDVTKVIEQGSTARPSSGATNPANILDPLPPETYSGVGGATPFRASTGCWSYDLTPALYQIGRSYTVNWRYEMTPDNLRVEHVSFMWNPPPVRPRDSANCVISDSLYDLTGTPKTFERIVVEQYQDTFALANRIDSIDVQTDVFGNWWIELPRGVLLRFLIGDRARVIRVPDDYIATLSKIPDVQPEDVRKDRFGYPL